MFGSADLDRSEADASLRGVVESPQDDIGLRDEFPGRQRADHSAGGGDEDHEGQAAGEAGGGGG